MNNKIIKCDGTKLKNTNTNDILINVIDIKKIVVSNKCPFGKQDLKYYSLQI